MITLIYKISLALDEGNYVLGIFFELSKAFDTVNHYILCKKNLCVIGEIGSTSYQAVYILWFLPIKPMYFEVVRSHMFYRKK